MKPVSFILIFFLPFFCQAQQSFVQQKALYFIENKGQVKDQNGQLRPDIDFKVSDGGASVFIGKGQLHYQFYKENKKGTVDANRIDMELEGANTNAELVRVQPEAYYERYYTGGCTGEIVHTYKKITYRNIYPYIDWVLYIKDDQLEYDFTVRPGGDVNNIKIRYRGADKLLNSSNTIAAITGSHRITEQGLYAYEKESGKQISAGYTLHKKRIGFDVDQYNGTLVIDPQLVWGTYYGDSAEDWLLGDAYYNEDAVLFGGVTRSNKNIATSGSFKSVYTFDYDLFLARFNGSGNRLWATYYGDNFWVASVNYNHAVTADRSGNMYLCGQTADTGLATKGRYKGGSFDGLLVKFNISGARVWSEYIGGSGLDGLVNVITDKSDNIYISGWSTSDTGIATPGTYITDTAGDNNFLIKLDANGNKIWGTYLVTGTLGSGYSTGTNSMACDSAANVYITGATVVDSMIATPGAYQINCNCAHYTIPDAFLIKIDGSNGKRLWGTYFGGDTAEGMPIVSCDRFNNVYLYGMTGSKDLATTGTYATTLYGKMSPFLVKFDSSGNRLWCSYLNQPSCQLFSNDVACDGAGGVYVDYNQHIAAVYSDTVFTAKMDVNGRHILNRVYRGSNRNAYNMYSYIMAPAGKLYVAGYSYNDSLLTTAGSFMPTRPASFGADCYLQKFIADTTVLVSQYFADTFLCLGASFNLPYVINEVFNTGNVFTVQLSNPLGSFSSPTTIGSVTAVNEGSISCTLPAAITAGYNYRIRIVSSNPYYVSPDNGSDIVISNKISGVSITDNGPVCLNDELKLTANSDKGVHYSWTGPAGFTSTKNAFNVKPFTSANAGRYIVTVSAPGCPNKKDTTDINIKPAVTPTVNITMSPDTGIKYGVTVLFTATVTNAGTSPKFHWYKNGVLIPYDSSGAFVSDSVQAGDVIRAVLYSKDPCAVPDTAIASTWPLGASSISSQEIGVHVYPNPNDGSFMIESLPQGKTTIEIVNEEGQIIHAETFVPDNTRTGKITLERNVPNGVYYLRVKSATVSEIWKFTVYR